jgi:hypothetical protein
VFNRVEESGTLWATFLAHVRDGGRDRVRSPSSFSIIPAASFGWSSTLGSRDGGQTDGPSASVCFEFVSYRSCTRE